MKPLTTAWLTFGLLWIRLFPHGGGGESEFHPDAVLPNLGDDKEPRLALVRSHVVHILNHLRVLQFLHTQQQGVPAQGC